MINLIRLAMLTSVGLVVSAPAQAIPSPELIVGSLTSGSQLLALASGLFGSLAIVGIGVRSGASRRMIGGLLIVLALAVAGNIFQYIHSSNEKRDRLEATLARPSRTPGMPVVDPTLKEINFADQTRHPLGISTRESAELLERAAEGDDSVMFIDVREAAETATGTLSSAIIQRWPDIDLPKLKDKLNGKQAILFCHNGNRSSETCAALAALGIDCRFVVGGLEKWLTEGRKIAGLQDRTLQTLRAIPRYPNDRVLLDTAEVKSLVEKEGAYFLDVRYPGEFAAGHLPDARNLTIRTTPTPVLKATVAALPHKPIIIPCYDRRSCFFGETMALELSKAGHDFRGRYTVPWEYFAAPSTPPHVIAWAAEQGVWPKAVKMVARPLGEAAQSVGFVAAIILLAALSRLLVLPFSLKAERDQRKARALAPQLADLRITHAADPVRRSRALRAIYRQNGLTPGRNLLALLFLPLLAVCVSAVQQVAGAQGGGWAERDATLVLPVIFGLLTAAYLHLSFARTRVQALGIWALGVPVFAGIAATLGFAVDVYMIASMALLLAQAGLMRRPLNALRVMQHKRAGVVPLAEAGVEMGGKAHRLGVMVQSGVPVPNGVVLTAAFLSRYASSKEAARRSMLSRIWSKVGASAVAVRSSAAAEDGKENSFAGIFESRLNIRRDGLEAAIEAVMSSFSAERALSYGTPGAPNIIVQEMAQTEYSGVLFTRDPASAGHLLIELTTGSSEALVSGGAVGATFRFTRRTHQLTAGAPPIDLAPLVALGERVEALFGGPQDIEWTYARGQFSLVQARDVTRFIEDPIEAERDRLIAIAGSDTGTVFMQTEMSEVLPNPTPLSLSLMQQIWAPGGSVDLACRSLGLAYDADEAGRDYLVTIYGRLYVDTREAKARAPRVHTLAARRLRRMSEGLVRKFYTEFSPRLDARLQLLEVADFGALAEPNLKETLASAARTFVTETYAEVEVINIAAAFYVEEARRLLTEAGVDAATALAEAPRTQLATDLVRAALASSVGEQPEALRRALGHRADFDYELSCPRYSEAPSRLLDVAHMHAHRQRPGRLFTGLNARTQAALARAHAFITLKEDAKHQALREVAIIRRVALALGARWNMGELIFQLTLPEIARCLPAERISLAQHRKSAADRFAPITPAPSLATSDLERVGVVATQTGNSARCGTRVSGGKAVTGRALVPGDDVAGAISRMRDGDILIANMVSPAWFPQFRRLGGIACELGGWLSHTAILAREHDVPMVVGLSGADIAEGDIVRLELDGRLTKLAQTANRLMVVA